MDACRQVQCVASRARMTRCPSPREERKGWDVISRKTGERVTGPWATVEEMLGELESRISRRGIVSPQAIIWQPANRP
jgi:hypothetical protein